MPVGTKSGLTRPEPREYHNGGKRHYRKPLAAVSFYTKQEEKPWSLLHIFIHTFKLSLAAKANRLLPPPLIKQKKEYILDSNGNKIYDPAKRQYKCRFIPSTDWNIHAKADEWRKAWEDMENAELERFGFEGRLDRRSYEEQGIEKIPTVHLGPATLANE